MNLVSFTFWPP